MDPEWFQWLPEFIVPLTILGVALVVVPYVLFLWALISITRSQRRIAQCLEELSKKAEPKRERKEVDREWRIER